MKAEVRTLVQHGLHEENLRKLIQICKALHNESPSCYGSLILIFESLAEEYDSQGITATRYGLIVQQIQSPILLLLEEENNPTIFMARLDDVFKAFATLKDY